MYGLGFGAFRHAMIGSLGAPPASYLLDTYTGASLAYSFRKLKSTSTNCVRVRRSSDNAEQDFGFVSNILDTSSLSTFVGANNGFVVTWYDQSGNANNLVQSNATHQPKIISSGTLNLLNGLPTINSSGNYMTQVSSVNAKSSFLVGNYTSLNLVNYISDIHILGGSFAGINGCWLTDGVNSISGTTETTSTKLLSCLSLSSGNTSRLFVNNISEGTSTLLNNSATQQIFGKSANLGNLSNIGNLSEVIYYDSDQYSNFSAINSNINTYYGIY